MGSIADLKKRMRSTKTDDEDNKKSGSLAKLKERIDRSRVYGVDDDYIKSFLDDSQYFISSASDTYNGINYKNASSMYSNINAMSGDLNERSSNIRAFINSNKDNMDEESYKSISSYLDDFSKSSEQVWKAFYNAKSNFDKYETEYDYNAAVMNSDDSSVEDRRNAHTANSERVDELDKMLKGKFGFFSRFMTDDQIKKAYGENAPELFKEKERLSLSNNQYERGLKVNDDYYDFTLASDFYEDSAYRDYSNPTKDDYSKYYAIVNNPNISDSEYQSAVKNKPEIVDRLGLFLSATEQEHTAAVGGQVPEYDDVLIQGSVGSWNQLKNEEIEIYYYLLRNNGKETADKYLDDMKTELNRRETQGYTDYIFNEASGLEKLALNIASVPMSVLGGLPAIVDDAVNIVKGKDINPYSFGHVMQNVSQDTRSATAEDLNELTNNTELLGITLGDAYQSVMSTADSAVGVALGSGVYGVLMGMGAASSEARELYEKGASKGQIAWGGILAGAAEMIFEKVSIEHFFKLGNPKSKLQIVKNLLSQGGFEASEEVFTEVANTISDAIVMGSQSDWDQSIQKYLDRGMTESEATGRALMDVGKNVWKAGIGGFISGGLLGGVGGTSSYLNYKNAATKHGQSIIDTGGYDDLMALAKDVTGANQNANVPKGDIKHINKLLENASKDASPKNVGFLSDQLNDFRSTQNKADIQSALMEKGLNKRQAGKVADYLNNAVEGGEYTNAQVEQMMNNDAIMQVAREISDNKDSSVNKRNKQHNLGRVGVKVSEDGSLSLRNAQNKAKSVGEGNSKTRVKNVIDSELSVSDDGVTKIAETGKAVKINGIADIKTEKGENGKVYAFPIYNVVDSDGNESVVSSRDVEYGNRAEGILYESFANLGLDPSCFNTYDEDLKRDGIDITDENAVSQFALDYELGVNFGIAGLESEIDMVNLSEVSRAHAYASGMGQAKADLEAEQSAIDKAVEERKASGKGKVKTIGKVHYDQSKLNNNMRRSGVELGKRLAALGLDVYFYESHQDAQGNFVDDNGNLADNGYYLPGDGSIHIDLNAGSNGTGVMVYTMAHELVHFMRRNNPREFKIFADKIVNWYGKKGQSVSSLIDKRINDEGLSWGDAYEEVIARSCEAFFTDSNAAERLAELEKTDKKTANIIRNWIRRFMNWVRSLYKDIDPESAEGQLFHKWKNEVEEIHDAFFHTLKGAVESYQWIGSMDVSTDAVAVEETTKHSYRSLAEAAGFEAIEENGIRGYYRNGERVSDVTVEDIEISPIGAMINYSLEMGDIDKDAADRQKKMFADICTMCAKTNDFAMSMQFVGSAVFTGMKANADKQYGTTYDFPSICTKTQAVIDAMSARMVKLNRGLGSEEILNIYQEVFASGNPVPCPECYVFSRWIGIGGLLDNIYKYQTHYGKLGATGSAKAYAEFRKKVEAFAKENGITFGKAKGALASKVTKSFADLKEKIEKADNQGETVKDSDRQKLKDLENMMTTVKSMSWLESVYFAESPVDSNGNPKENPKVNKNFAVPAEVLFDLNKGEEFAAKYKEAWGFRTTQGAGYGKAITPYADAVLGEGILATNNTTKTIKNKAQEKLNNPFLEQRGMLDKSTKRILERARLKQKIQAFLGGQRFQSTSDARYENASDYLLAALEMQAMRGKVQVYTKVDGAVPAFSAWGFSINQSLMPLGGGINPKGEVIDTAVGGMNPKVAFKNRVNHETAGTITIGVNDNHIRKLFEDFRRDFIIPYHASGGKAWLVNAFRQVQDRSVKRGAFVRSTDYSRTQSDKVLSDDVLRWQGKSDAEIEQIHAIREARLDILTGGKPNMDVVRGNRFLSALYDKFNGGEWDGVKVAKSKVESQIFPNEFWDQSVTYEQSGKITQDYLDYCDDLGFLHRFSGLVPKNGILIPVNGYNEHGEKVQLQDLAYKYDKNGNKTDEIEPYFWKVLTDRRMYDNNGNYLAQKAVTLNDTTTDTVTGFAKKNDGRQYNALLSMETAYKIANGAIGVAGDRADGEGRVNTSSEAIEFSDVNIKHSLRKTAPFLSNADRISGDISLADVEVMHSIRKKSPPNKTVEVYKLMRLKDGKIYPLFIDSTEPLDIGTWYDADSPNLDFLKQMPSGIFLVDTDNESYTTFEEYLSKSGEKQTKFPSKKAIEQAAADGTRWVYIEDVGRGQKRFGGETRKYWNLGINGSGAVSTFSMRPGYHAGSLPSMRQIGKGANKDLRDDTFVWTIGEVPADIDYQQEADSNPDKDIPTHIPVDGYYLKATNADKAKSQADVIGWYVAGSYKINRIISDSDARKIIDDWNAEHPNAQAQYDYDRESGMDFDAESMSLVPREYDVQPMYSRRGVSNRSLLVSALDGAAKNDIEKKRLDEYKGKIALIESEQNKLTELRARIKELSFAPGTRDTVAIKNLQDAATRVANRINTYDRQLLNLEATAPLKAVLEREKELAKKKAQQEGREALSAYREKAAKTLKETITRNQEARKRGIESRNKTEMRHKIKNVVSELNQLLLHGTKDRHIMIDLQKATADALSAVNMDTVNAEKRLAEIQRKIDASSDPDEIERLQQTYDRIELQGENMSQRLTALKDAYEEIKDSSDPLVANAYHPEIEDRIKNLRKEVGDTPLRDMSLEQLELVYDTYKMVLTTIRNANKLFKAKKSEDIATIGNRVMDEVREVGGSKTYIIKKSDWLNKQYWNNMKPVYAFKAIGSDTLSEMFDNVRAGEDTWAVDVSEAKEFFRETANRYGYDSWDFDKQYKFTSKTGKEFSLSIEQIMSMYAYSKRKQADEHLEKGGFVFDGDIEVTKKTKLGVPITYKVNTATAHNISKDQLGYIIATLSESQKAFVDEMQSYLSDTMGAKGNEVSLELYGVKLFKEKTYFPLKSAKQFMFEKNEVAGEVRLRNSGFSKETVEHASNPIILSNFMDVWSSHVNDMSMYHAFVLPLEDFNRVFNYKTPTTGNIDTESVKMYIQNAYGSHPVEYIKQLLTDINGGARTDPTADVITKMTGKFKKAAVFASASVVVQQPSALARAFALVDPKYFATKPFSATQHKAEWQEVKKYAPVAIIKEMGYFDTNMGRSTTDFIKAKEYNGLKEKAKGVVVDSDYRDEVISKLPALADEVTWCYIWNAVKKEVADTTELDAGSEGFLEKCGKRFTEVIVNTQVYDSVLSRSAMMRSKDTGMKMLTSFMAEPTTSINMLVDAVIQGKRGNGKAARKIVGAVVASLLLNSVLSAIVYAGRDDDEDKTYAEKYAKAIISEILDSLNPLTMIPFVKDIISICQGYDVERSDMAVISDLYNAFNKLSSDNYSAWRKIEDFGGAIASLFGLPLKNIMREMRGIYNTVTTFTSGQKTTGRGMGQAILEALPGKDKDKGEQLYDAIISGDKAHEERLRKGYKTPLAAEIAIRTALRENDPRIKQAAEARNRGNISEYSRIARQIIAEGYFSQDTVVSAINSEINAMNKGESSAQEDTTVEPIFRAKDINAALENGDTATAKTVISEIISEKVADGKTEKEAKASVKSSITSYWKPIYLEAYNSGNSTEMTRIRRLLEATGLYVDNYKKSTVVETCQNWVKNQ